MKRVAAAVATAVLALACSKSSTGVTANPGACSVTLSGAVTGTYNCTPTLLAWASGTNLTTFNFSIIQSGAQPGIEATIVWMGQPATGDKTISSSALASNVAVATSAGQAWNAEMGPMAQPQGAFDLHLTSVGGAVTTTQGDAYTGHGTLTATLAPVTGQMGSVTLTATF